jgi:hypothetical protein
MTLMELGTEYMEQSESIRTQIRNLRPSLNNLSGQELLDMRRKITSLYQMSLDCRRIGEHLKNYYD